MLAILGRILFLYIFISLLRFFFLDDVILSTSPLLVIVVIVMGIMPTMYKRLIAFVQIDKRGKNYRYYVKPLETMVATYLFLSFFRYALMQDVLFTSRLEIIFVAIFASITEAVLAKIDDVSPRDPKTEARKPFTYYYDKYVVNGTAFHKLMFVVYGLCILLFVSMMIYMFLIK